MNKRKSRCGLKLSPEKAAACLMRRQYVTTSALLSLNGKGQIIGIEMFHSAFFDGRIRRVKGTAGVWLMINHPGGESRLTSEEYNMLKTVLGLMRGMPVRVFVTGEDVVCREILRIVCEKKSEPDEIRSAGKA